MTLSGTVLILSGFFGINLAGGSRQSEDENLEGGIGKSKNSDIKSEEEAGLLRPGMTEDGGGGR